VRKLQEKLKQLKNSYFKAEHNTESLKFMLTRM